MKNVRKWKDMRLREAILGGNLIKFGKCPNALWVFFSEDAQIFAHKQIWQVLVKYFCTHKKYHYDIFGQFEFRGIH